jgi:hypothetical protein
VIEIGDARVAAAGVAHHTIRVGLAGRDRVLSHVADAAHALLADALEILSLGVCGRKAGAAARRVGEGLAHVVVVLRDEVPVHAGG